MKVFYITSKPPYPVIDGGCYASAQFLDLLIKAGYEVAHFAIGTQKHPFNPNSYPDEIQENASIHGQNINTDVSAVDAFIHLFKKGSYNVNRFHDKKVERTMKSHIISFNPEIIIFDSLYSTPYLELIEGITDARIILRSHNVECDIWSDMARTTTNAVKQAYLKKLSKDLQTYEIDTINKLDCTLCISPADLSRYVELGVDSSLHYIPVNIPVTEAQPDYTNCDLLHVGSINWEPNKESVEKLVSWLPELKKKHPSVRLCLIGSGYDGTYQQFDPETIKEEGFIDNLEERCMQGGILVTLIDSGSGVRIKILEMMAMGIPVISNSKGLKGIETDAVIKADDMESFVNHASELLGNQELRETIGKKCKQHIRDHYNFEDISEKLNGILGKS